MASPRLSRAGIFLSVAVLAVLLPAPASHAMVIGADPLTAAAVTVAVGVIVTASMLTDDDLSMIHAIWPMLTDDQKEKIIKRLLESEREYRLTLPEDYTYELEGKEYTFKEGTVLIFRDNQMYFDGDVETEFVRIEGAVGGQITEYGMNVQSADSVVIFETSGSGEVVEHEFTDVGYSEIYFDEAFEKAVLTSAKDDNVWNLDQGTVVVTLGKDDKLNISTYSDRFNLSISSKSGVVDDYMLRVACIDIGPGSKYRYHGLQYDRFALYEPSTGETFRLCMRTEENDSFTMCESCGVLDFLELSGLLEGVFEYEKIGTVLLFTDIIEAKVKSSYWLEFSEKTDKILDLEHGGGERHVYSGPFDMHFNTSYNHTGYRFHDYTKPYSVTGVRPDIRIGNETLTRKKPGNIFIMYARESAAGREFLSRLEGYV